MKVNVENPMAPASSSVPATGSHAEVASNSLMGNSTVGGGDVRGGAPILENLGTVSSDVVTELVVNEPTTTGATKPGVMGAELNGKKVPEKPVNKAGKASFASLFKNNRMAHANYKLDFVETGDERLVFDDAVVDTVEQTFGVCLLGFVVNGRPPTAALLDLVRRWGPNITFQTHESGWIIFSFPSIEIKEAVLARGPYMVFGFHLFLKEMPRFFRFQEEDLTTLPAWVRIHGIPPCCWNSHILSRVASKIGKPIHMDMFTHNRKRVNYARVLVELDTSKARMESISIGLPVGTMEVSFVYEDKLEFCHVCKKLGHPNGSCVPDLKDKVVENSSTNCTVNEAPKEVDKGKEAVEDLVNNPSSSVGLGIETEAFTEVKRKKNKNKSNKKKKKQVSGELKGNVNEFFLGMEEGSSCDTEFVSSSLENKNVRYFGNPEKGRQPKIVSGP